MTTTLTKTITAIAMMAALGQMAWQVTDAKAQTLFGMAETTEYNGITGAVTESDTGYDDMAKKPRPKPSPAPKPGSTTITSTGDCACDCRTASGHNLSTSPDVQVEQFVYSGYPGRDCATLNGQVCKGYAGPKLDDGFRSNCHPIN